MTKKDYGKIAEAIAVTGWHNPMDENTAEGWHAAVCSIRHRIADILEADNPRFDRQRFLEASRRKSSVTPE